MPGKIFPQHPLKRADLRRLQEPPKPVETAPDLSLTIWSAADEEAKRARTRERARERAREREIVNGLREIALGVEPSVIDCKAFLRWMVLRLADLGSLDRRVFVNGCNITLGAMRRGGRCFVCQEPTRMQRGGSFLVFDKFADPDGQRGRVLEGFACVACAGRKPRFYALLFADIMRTALGATDLSKALHGRLATIDFTTHDKEFLEWLAEGEPGRERIHALRDAGVVASILNDIETMIDTVAEAEVSGASWQAISKNMHVRYATPDTVLEAMSQVQLQGSSVEAKRRKSKNTV
jgi:hypothetical protein